MRLINFFIYFFVISVIIFSSCNKEEEVDKSTPYDNVQGLWYYSFECDTLSDELIELELLPTSFNVEGEGDGELSLIFFDSLDIIASIDNEGNLVIPEQELFEIPAELVNELIGLAIPLTLNISGAGYIDSKDIGNLILTYSVISNFEISCELDLFRAENDGGFSEN